MTQMKSHAISFITPKVLNKICNIQGIAPQWALMSTKREDIWDIPPAIVLLFSSLLRPYGYNQPLLLLTRDKNGPEKLQQQLQTQ